MRELKGRKSERELRTEVVRAHVTLEEKKKIIQAAKNSGMDVSTFIRTVCIYKQFNKFCNSIVREIK